MTPAIRAAVTLIRASLSPNRAAMLDEIMACERAQLHGDHDDWVASADELTRLARREMTDAQDALTDAEITFLEDIA